MQEYSVHFFDSFTYGRKKLSKFPATRPLDSDTFLHEINTSEVKITLVLKKNCVIYFSRARVKNNSNL